MFTNQVTVPPAGGQRVFWRFAAPVGLAEAEDGTPSVVLTVTEACITLRVSRWTLYQLIRSGRLRTIKIGRRRYIPRHAVTALVERLSTEETW